MRTTFRRFDGPVTDEMRAAEREQWWACAIADAPDRRPTARRTSRPTRSGRTRTHSRGCATRRVTKAGGSRSDGSDQPGEPSSSPRPTPIRMGVAA